MKDEAGQALAIVLGVMTILFLILGAVLGWSSVASKQYGRENPNLQDRAALRSGVEGVIWELQNDGDGANPNVTLGTDILDTAQYTYNTFPTGLFPPSLCQPPDCSGLSVSATLDNRAVALCIVGPAMVYEGTTVTYAVYATDGANCTGRVVSTKSLGLIWTCSPSAICGQVGSSDQFMPPGDTGNEGAPGESRHDPGPSQAITVQVSSSVAGVTGASVSVAVDDE